MAATSGGSAKDLQAIREETIHAPALEHGGARGGVHGPGQHRHLARLDARGKRTGESGLIRVERDGVHRAQARPPVRRQRFDAQRPSQSGLRGARSMQRGVAEAREQRRRQARGPQPRDGLRDLAPQNFIVPCRALDLDVRAEPELLAAGDGLLIAMKIER